MTRRTTWIGTASLLALAVLTQTPSAQAQGAQQADALAADAKKLFADGKTAEACKKYEESQKAEARGSTLLDLAACHEKEGKTATAVNDYKAAAAAAHKEKRYDREKTAKLKVLQLEPKIPRLTVTVASGDTAGLDVALDGVSLMKSEWGKPRPVDPGEHAVGATATGRKAFSDKITLANGDKKTVAVPALAEEGKAGGAAAATPPGKEPAKTDAKPTGTTAAASTAAPPKPEEKPGPGRQAGRIVGEVGAFAGLLVGGFETGTLDKVADTTYRIKVPGNNEVIKACTEDACEAHFDTTLGLLIGGEGFIGYAITDKLHLGARGFGAARLKGGWMFVGGPAGSLNVGPLWVGVSFLVGAAKQTAKVTDIRGKVPPEYQSLNGGEDVPVPAAPGTPTESSVTSGFALGGNLEISYPLLAFEPGSLMVAAWPMFLKASNGYILMIPAGLAFRFH